MTRTTTTDARGDGERRPYLYLDLGFYAACNLKCTYCREEIVRDDQSFTLTDLVQQVELFEQRFQAGVVKLSGYGEISMWPDFGASLDFLSPRFPAVQVISNGTFGEGPRQAILAHANVYPNITIDGHTLAMNRLRIGNNAQLHERILDNVEAFVAAGRPIEINCVLHVDNANGLDSFCQHLHEVDGGRGLIMLFPFPVKPFDRARFATDSLRKGFSGLSRRLPELWLRYADILPPQAYCDELQTVLDQGTRDGDCHVHWANLGSGSRNERLHCPNYGEDLSYGPMLKGLSSNADAIAEAEREHLAAGEVGPNCVNCYNHFHIINHYLEGKTSLAELCRVPSLRAPGVAESAQALKREFQRQRARQHAAERTYFHHVSLEVRLMGASLDFYCGLFDFEERASFAQADGSRVVHLVTPGASQALELIESDDARSNRSVHLGFRCENLDAVLDRLSRAGIELERGPERIGAERLAFVRDPDGCLIEINDGLPEFEA